MGYDTLWEAEHMAYSQQWDSGDPDIWPYKCFYCPRWHIGHTKRKPKYML